MLLYRPTTKESSVVFCVFMPCILVEGYTRFWESMFSSLTLEISEIMVTAYGIIRRQNSEELLIDDV
jgi:hypothetical protein